MRNVQQEAVEQAVLVGAKHPKKVVRHQVCTKFLLYICIGAMRWIVNDKV